MAKAIDVAKYLIIRATKDEDPITHIKLQKLCYYALGVFSKLSNGKKLFSENVEAWPHGPVVRDVYKQFSKSKSNFLKISEDYSDLQLTESEKEAIGETYKHFSQYSAWKMRNLIFEEDPWKDNFEENKKNIIPFKDIKNFFDKALTIL